MIGLSWASLIVAAALADDSGAPASPNTEPPAAQTPPPDEGPLTVSWTEAKILSKTDIPYPEGARALGLDQVSCTIRIFIDEAGVPTQIKAESCHPAFLEATTTAVMLWRFEPLLRDGIAVPVQFLLKVNFVLEDSGPAFGLVSLDVEVERAVPAPTNTLGRVPQSGFNTGVAMHLGPVVLEIAYRHFSIGGPSNLLRTSSVGFGVGANLLPIPPKGDWRRGLTATGWLGLRWSKIPDGDVWDRRLGLEPRLGLALWGGRCREFLLWRAQAGADWAPMPTYLQLGGNEFPIRPFVGVGVGVCD